jgi:hypothetical protein
MKIKEDPTHTRAYKQNTSLGNADSCRITNDLYITFAMDQRKSTAHICFVPRPTKKDAYYLLGEYKKYKANTLEYSPAKWDVITSLYK